MIELKKIRDDLLPYIAQRKTVLYQAKEEKRVLEETKTELTLLLESQRIIQEIAQTVQLKAHERITSLVSQCLEEVFEKEAYKFKIRFDRKRGRTEATLLFERDGNEVDPTFASGGGVVDVASFALRLTCLILSQPKRRRFLCLDEPFRFLSREYRPRIRELILALAKELDVQFLIITHSPEFVVGKVIELKPTIRKEK